MVVIIHTRLVAEGHSHAKHDLRRRLSTEEGFERCLWVLLETSAASKLLCLQDAAAKAVPKTPPERPGERTFLQGSVGIRRCKT